MKPNRAVLGDLQLAGFEDVPAAERIHAGDDHRPGPSIVHVAGVGEAVATADDAVDGHGAGRRIAELYAGASHDIAVDVERAGASVAEHANDAGRRGAQRGVAISRGAGGRRAVDRERAAGGVRNRALVGKNAGAGVGDRQAARSPS